MRLGKLCAYLNEALEKDGDLEVNVMQEFTLPEGKPIQIESEVTDMAVARSIQKGTASRLIIIGKEII